MPSARPPAAASDATVIDGCTCFRARRLARRITQIYDRVLAPSGLRVTQFSLLSPLLRSGPLAVGALATTLDMDRTTLTRNLKPLIDAGLVSLARSATDARQREIVLTEVGRARHRDAKKLWRRAQDEINRTLGSPKVVSLHRLFDGVVETLDRSHAAKSPA